MKLTLLAVFAATALTAPQAFAQSQATPPVGPDFSKIDVKLTGYS